MYTEYLNHECNDNYYIYYFVFYLDAQIHSSQVVLSFHLTCSAERNICVFFNPSIYVSMVYPNCIQS